MRWWTPSTARSTACVGNARCPSARGRACPPFRAGCTRPGAGRRPPSPKRLISRPAGTGTALAAARVHDVPPGAAARDGLGMALRARVDPNPVGHALRRPGRSDVRRPLALLPVDPGRRGDRKSTRLNSSHSQISYAVFCLKKKTKNVYYLLVKGLHCRPKGWLARWGRAALTHWSPRHDTHTSLSHLRLLT